MDKFTASNGWAVYVGTNGEIVVGEPSLVSDPSTDDRAALFLPSQVDALREFFRAEGDAELGRWRWPEHPEYVVYPVIVPGHEMAFGPDLSVMVFHEPTGVLKGYCREEDEGGELSREYPAAARAYFAAHPVRKPWEDAQHGEVWAIRVGEGNEFAARVIRGTSDFPRFVSFDDEISYGPRAGIVSGRRIWPEVS